MSEQDEWEDPGVPGKGIDWTELQGRLLLITVHSVETGIRTVFDVGGTTRDAISADVTVLDGPSAGELKQNTLIFPRVLISQLKTKVGKNVLGRLGYGEAKAGQRPPWKLEAASAADKQIANNYRTRGPGARPASNDPWASPAPATGGNPPF